MYENHNDVQNVISKFIELLILFRKRSISTEKKHTKKTIFVKENIKNYFEDTRNAQKLFFYTGMLRMERSDLSL